MIEFRGIQKTTLIDYPGEVACTLFLGGCNFRCFYCFNPALVTDPDSQQAIPEDEIIDFLKERENFLDGVCITGGEPLLCGEELVDFLKKVKAMQYKIKLDTNGSLPAVLQQIIDEKLVDYLAMD
ncbi:MAG: anaerobic ribonucleoside-triphosphate reductase activating protein, partial [bacterium]